MAEQAVKYDYIYRPQQSQLAKDMRERDHEKMMTKGATGDPERCKERFINKLFDKLRKKSKDRGNAEGCDFNTTVRDKYVMHVGKTTSGGLRSKDKRNVSQQYRIMNKDNASPRNRHIDEVISKQKNELSRSSFDLENAFQVKFVKGPEGGRNARGQSTALEHMNPLHLQKLTQYQMAKIEPVLNTRTNSKSHLKSTYRKTEISSTY